MKKIRVFVTFLSILMCMSAAQISCYAATVADSAVNCVNDVVTITGVHPSGEGREVTVSVTRNGENEPYYWYGKTTSTGGAFTFSYKMDNHFDDNGTYTVRLGGAGLDMLTITYSYYLPTNESDILTLVNGATEYTGVKSAIETYGADIGIKIGDSIFDSLSPDGEVKVYESLVNRGFASGQNLKEAFYMSSAAQQLNEGLPANGEALLASYSKYLNIDVSASGLFGKIRSDAIKSRVYSQFIGNNLNLKNAYTFASEFDKTAALEFFNDLDSSNRSSLIDCIKEFNTRGYSDISLTAYNEANFTELEALNVASLFIEERGQNYFNSFTSVGVTFKNACDAAIVARNNNTGYDNNEGSYGSGAGGGSTKISVSKDIAENANITDNGNLVEFADLTNAHWAYNSIQKLVAREIVSGTGNNMFEPDRNVNREEFVKMLVGAFNLEEKQDALSFEDVNETAWYYKYLRTAYGNGIVTGKDDGLFGIGQTISREDLATMVFRAVKNLNIKMEATNNNHSFSDYNEVSDYAKEAVDYLYKTGIMNGVSKNEFSPKSTTTRAMAAKVIALVMERSGIN